MKEESVNLTSKHGDHLAGVFIAPQKSRRRFPVVILAHGYGSNKQGKTNTNATNYFIKRGFGIFKFDFSGHGESGGSIEDLTLSKGVDELSAAFDYVVSRNDVDKKRIGLLGVSYGGNVAIIFASKHKGIKALALKSPVSNYKEVRDIQLGQAKVQEWKSKGIITLDSNIRSKYQFYEDACKIDTYKSASIVSCPVYIVQGDADEVIPLPHTEKLYKSFKKKKKFTVIKGADHSYSNRKDFENSMNVLNSFLFKSLRRWMLFGFW